MTSFFALLVATLLSLTGLRGYTVSTAPTMVTTTRAQANFATGREKLDFAEGIALLDLNTNPMTYMTMKYGRGTSGNIAHKWIADQLCPETDQINWGTQLANSATGLVVDTVGKFALGDLVMHNQSREIMLVTSVGATFIGVVRDYGQATEGWTAQAETIDDNDYLTIIGNAWEQGAPLPSIRSTVEVVYTNYCQDQRTPIAESEVAAAAAVYGENDWTYQLRKIGIQHQRKIEYQNKWGKPYVGDKGVYVAATGNTAPQTGGGILHYIKQYGDAARKVLQAEITMAEFMDFLEVGFAYGPKEKFLFCPPKLRSALDFWGISKLQSFTKETLFGMSVEAWKSSHGDVVIITDKQLTEPGSDSAYAFLLDLSSIKWITYADIGSTRLRELEPYKATGATLKQAEYQTISCLEVKNIDHHAYLYGLTSYAA